MRFLEVIKNNYEENEHLHLLVKFDFFAIELYINEQLYTIKFQGNKCNFSEIKEDKTLPILYLNEAALRAVSEGILLSSLIANEQVRYEGSLRDKLLIESLLYLSTNKSEVVA